MVAERQFQSMFAKIFYNQIANQRALKIPTATAKGMSAIFQDQTMKDLLQLLDLNHYAWSVYAEPTREFLR